MSRKEPVADPAITQKVIQQLSARGLRTPCRINVQTRKGEVTLSGNVQYPHQRDAAIAAIRSVDGIRKVHDQIKVRPPVKHEFKTLPPAVKETAPVEAEATAETESAAETEAAETAETSAVAARGADAPAPLVAETNSSTTEFELGPAPVRRGPAAPPAISPAPPASTH